MAVCLPLALLAACGSSQPSLSGRSATEVLSISVTAAQQVGSFHFVDKTGTGSQAQVLVGDTGTVEAQQALSAGAASLDVRLVAGVVYLRAPALVLENLLALSATEAAAGAGRWLSVPSTNKSYAAIVKTLTPQAELDTYIPQIPLVLGAPTTLHGIPVIPVSGAAPPSASTGALNAKATLFVSDRSPYRPVGGALTGTDVHGRPVSDDVVFTRWGELPDVAVPSGAVSLESLTH